MVMFTLGSLFVAVQQFMSTTSQVIGELIGLFFRHKVFATMFLFLMMVTLFAEPSLNLCFHEGAFGCMFDLRIILVGMFLVNVATMLP